MFNVLKQKQREEQKQLEEMKKKAAGKGPLGKWIWQQVNDNNNDHWKLNIGAST